MMSFKQVIQVYFFNIDIYYECFFFLHTFIILESFLKYYVTLKTGVMMLKIQL